MNTEEKTEVAPPHEGSRGNLQYPALTVGVGGPSACGKTTLLRAMSHFLGIDNVAHFDLDGYHLHTRKKRMLLHEFPDELRANNFTRIAQDLKSLQIGRAIDMPRYDHVRGAQASPIHLSPRPFVFVEGLHACLINQISGCDLINMSIYISTDNDLMKSWKVRRDVNERGYTYDEAVKMIVDREPFAARHVYPQEKMADVLIVISKKQRLLYNQHVLLSTQFLRKAFPGPARGRLLSKQFALRPLGFRRRWYVEIQLRRRARLARCVRLCLARSTIVLPRSSARVKMMASFDPDVIHILCNLVLHVYARRACEWGGMMSRCIS
jgi:uridine kinase